ncbi:MAG TPA: hypothetical protein VIG97_07310 [Luteimonas sp.]
MNGATHGGKGSGRRPEAEDGAYARGWDAIFGKKSKAAGCACDPAGSDGATCPGEDGRPLCEVKRDGR